MLSTLGLNEIYIKIKNPQNLHFGKSSVRYELINR